MDATPEELIAARDAALNCIKACVKFQDDIVGAGMQYARDQINLRIGKDAPTKEDALHNLSDRIWFAFKAIDAAEFLLIKSLPSHVHETIQIANAEQAPVVFDSDPYETHHRAAREIAHRLWGCLLQTLPKPPWAENLVDPESRVNSRELNDEELSAYLEAVQKEVASIDIINPTPIETGIRKEWANAAKAIAIREKLKPTPDESVSLDAVQGEGGYPSSIASARQSRLEEVKENRQRWAKLFVERMNGKGRPYRTQACKLIASEHGVSPDTIKRAAKENQVWDMSQ